MNPHRLTWGFAYALPFSQMIIGATLLGAVVSKEPKKPKGGAATVVLLLFVCYFVATTLFALVPDVRGPGARARRQDPDRDLPRAAPAVQARARRRADVGHRGVDRLLRGEGRALHDRDARRRPCVGPGRQLHRRQQRLCAGDRDVDPGLGVPLHAVLRAQVAALGHSRRHHAVGTVGAREPVAWRAARDRRDGAVPVEQEPPEADHRACHRADRPVAHRLHAARMDAADGHDLELPAGRLGGRPHRGVEDALQPGLGPSAAGRRVRALRTLGIRDLQPGISRCAGSAQHLLPGPRRARLRRAAVCSCSSGRWSGGCARRSCARPKTARTIAGRTGWRR